MTHYSSASLYVGDLHPQVNESFLFEVFSEVGTILSIKVCRDAMTGNSLGYAYVNFQSPKDAERAIDALNYTQVKGKPIRIMWSQRDPAVRRSGDGNIFIKNLDKSVDNKSLYDTFSIFGNILSCKVSTAVVKTKDGKTKPTSLGYGFVHFETKSAADDAIKTVNGMLIKGKKVYVGKFLSKKERDAKRKPVKFTNIFVKNISSDVDEKTLLKTFGNFGEINSHTMKKDKKTKLQFAFLNFKKPEDAKKALDFNGKQINDKGNKLYVSRAQVKSEREMYLQKEFERRREEYMKKYQGVNLYVKNLDDTFDEDAFRKIFGKYGKITSAVIMRDDKKKSKGFGFVCFSKIDEANKALTELNGKMVGSKPLYVSVAQRKEIRKQLLEQQYQQQIRGMQMMQPNLFQQQQNNQGGGNQMQSNDQFFKNQQQQQPFMKPRWTNNRSGGNHHRNKKQGPSNSGGKRGYKYNQNARNRPDQQNTQQNKKSQRRGDQQNTQQDVLNPSFLAQYSSQQQKRYLGDRIYPLVHYSHPEQANKITGMLLEMDTGDILHLLENTDALNAKIVEALNVLKASEKVLKEESKQGNQKEGETEKTKTKTKKKKEESTGGSQKKSTKE